MYVPEVHKRSIFLGGGCPKDFEPYTSKLLQIEDGAPQKCFSNDGM